jgi:pimeloyl-ACP methyl ester carboxylesterase
VELAGFFAVRIDEPGSERTFGAEGHAKAGRPEGQGAASGGYAFHLGWVEGVPYITDLGRAGEILVNSTPIEPNEPVVIQVGDRITIGDIQLTWHAGTEADQPEAPSPRVTVVLPRAEEAPPPPTPARTEVLSEPHEPTVLAEPILPTKADIPEKTVVVSEQAAQSPGAIAPAEPAPPSEETGESPGVEIADKTQVVPEALAQPPPKTLVVPSVATRPPGPEEPDDRPEPPGEDAAASGEPFTYKTAWVDVAKILEEQEDLEFESTTILRDTQIPRLVIHLPGRTWETQFGKERMTIGRGEGNDIMIPDESVSRHHASIERQGDDYVLREAQSRNGIWLGKQRVEEHTLRDGDVLNLGRARLAFQDGFTSDDLTLIGTPRIDGKPARRPVVFVPGLMGSQLWIGSECIWPATRTILSNPELLRLPSDPRIEPRGIVNEVVIVPNIIELRQYSGLGDYLEEGLGYRRGKDLFEFSYDWRQDIRLAAQRLAEAIEGWRIKAPITVIGHSLGTLVTRYYVERLGGKKVVERIILMGGPHYGTPKALAALLSGPGMLPFGLGAERMRQVLSTFLSSYQILPTYDCVTDQQGKSIDVMKNTSWLPEAQRPFLAAARSFRRELGELSSVPCVSIFGYGLKTQLRAKVHRQSSGAWKEVEFIIDTAGDQSVPTGSAVLKGSEIHPVFQEHGSLYVDDSVRMRLKLELTRSTTWQRR